jgi:hypothetical protein
MLLLISTVSAQQAATSVPNLIRYSGTLKDAQGAASTAPTVVGVTFAIYKQQDGGAAVWQETQNVALDASGQYSVVLGSTTTSGLPDDLFSQQEQRWLGVQVQGQTEEARVLLVSVPYAFKAHEAETLGGLPASAFVQAAPSSASGSGSSVAGTAVNGSAGAGSASKGEGGTGQILTPSTTFINTKWWYDIKGSRIVSVGNTGPADSSSTNLFLGWLTGQANTTGTGNVFTGLNSGWLNTTGHDNAFYGWQSGYGNSGGNYNSCFGSNACLHTTTGIDNTSIGAYAGYRNDTGNNNTYVGYEAAWTNGGNINNNTFMGWSAGFNNLGSNGAFYGYQSGYANTADGNSFFGYQSGMANTTGVNNTFIGYQSGFKNSSGFSNTFVGTSAGFNSTTSASTGNTFVGTNAGYFADTVAGSSFFGYAAGQNTVGPAYGNTFSGYDAGRSNTTGIDNAIYGYNAGYNIAAPTTGSYNTYLGVAAGSSISGALTSGSNNTCVGYAACNNENNVSNNIEINNSGPAPASNTILIGTQGTQTDTYVAGIWNSTPGGAPEIVCVDSTGKLWGSNTGCMGSSRRFKDQIADMADSSSKLFQLRPVTFLYKPQYDDGSRQLQFGLIAEEVAKVYPEMAVYDKDGQPSGVKYQLLAPMLLNELQKEHAVVMTQQDQLQTQLQQIKAQRQEIDGLKRQLQLQNASLQERLQRLESYVETQMKTATDNPPRTTIGANGGLQ